MTVKPISPDDVIETRAIPDAVVMAWNEMISFHWDGISSQFYQKDLIDLILEKVNSGERSYSRQDVVDKRWLDLESIYRAKGWRVVYDKPAFNESYEPSFTFTRGRKRST